MADFIKKLELVNKALLLAIQNPTTMPLIIKTILAINIAAAASGANPVADVDALNDLVALQQNLIDAKKQAEAGTPSALPSV